MPQNIPDLAWYVSTAVIVLLIAMIGVILGWGFTLLVKKFDQLTSRLEHWIDEVVEVKASQQAHRILCDERHRRDK